MHKFYIYLLLVLTFAVYVPTTESNFLNWDDNAYITENPDTQNLSFKSIKLYFTKSYNNTYVPLSMLSWAVEYSIFGDNPFVFILNNILLHLLCVFLVFKISKYFFDNNWLSLFVAAIFALHPVHVESVSWITERKDVLYAFFYFLALWCYLKDLNRKTAKRKYYILSIIFLILSLLSKGQAVSFVIFIILIDIYFKKDWKKWKNLREKVPFLLLSIIFGITAIYFQNFFSSGKVIYEFSLTERFLISSVALIKYIFLTLFPLYLSPIYPLPSPHQPLPFHFYIALISIPIYIFLTYIAWRKNKKIFFALSVFFVTLFMMLDHTQVGKVIIADRFLYVPVLGFAFLLAGITEFLIQKKQKNIVIAIASIVLIFYSFKTYTQTKIWQNDELLSGHALKKYPKSMLANSNYADALAKNQDFDNALKYYNKSIQIFPYYSDAFNNRGVLYGNLKNYHLALKDFDKAIQLADKNVVALANRGFNYYYVDNYNLAQKDFLHALKLEKNNIKALLGLASIYTKQKNFDKANSYIQKVFKISPNNAEAFNSLGVLYLENNQSEKALQNFNKSIKIDPKIASNFRYRGEIKGRFMNDYSGSKQDLLKAIEIDNYDYIAYNNLGIINMMMNDFDDAEKNFLKSYEIKPDYCEAIINICLFYIKQNNIDKAQKYIDEVYKNNCNINIINNLLNN